MSPKRRQSVLLAVLGTLVIVAVVVYASYRRPGKPAPNVAGTYYTGPKQSKGDPTLYADEEGRRAAPPPGSPSRTTSRGPAGPP